MKNFDRKLYRSSNQAWLGGVCAGVAECYGQPVWLIRILMITLFVFSGSLAALSIWRAYSCWINSRHNCHRKPVFVRSLVTAKMPRNGLVN